MQKICDKLLLEKTAVENWAKYQLKDNFYGLAEARAALIDCVNSKGKFSKEGPTWMTSKPEGIFAWILLPDDLCLTLQNNPESNERPYLATNCRAKGRKKKKDHAFASKTEVFPTKLESPEERKKVQISLHAQKRLWDRTDDFSVALRRQFLKVTL